MERIDENSIKITNEELRDIADFIRNSLDRYWDHYTDTYCMKGISWEDGMRRMNPEMYDLAAKMELI